MLASIFSLHISEIRFVVVHLWRWWWWWWWWYICKYSVNVCVYLYTNDMKLMVKWCYSLGLTRTYKAQSCGDNGNGSQLVHWRYASIHCVMNDWIAIFHSSFPLSLLFVRFWSANLLKTLMPYPGMTFTFPSSFCLRFFLYLSNVKWLHHHHRHL